MPAVWASVFQVCIGDGCVQARAIADSCAAGDLEAGQIHALDVADGELCEDEHRILVVVILRVEGSGAELHAVGSGAGTELVVPDGFVAELARGQRRVARAVVEATRFRAASNGCIGHEPVGQVIPRRDGPGERVARAAHLAVDGLARRTRGGSERSSNDRRTRLRYGVGDRCLPIFLVPADTGDEIHAR
jgi:hypothetical protein